MRQLLLLFFIVMFALVAHGQAQTKSDAELIKQTALDYIEGWYEGDPVRMERALHPDLAKRIVNVDQRGRYMLGQMSAMTLVQLARVGDGKSTPKEKQQKDVTVLDIFGNTASVKIIASRLGRLSSRREVAGTLGDRKRALGDETHTSAIRLSLCFEFKRCNHIY